MTTVINIRNNEKYDIYIGRADKKGVFDGFFGNPHTMGRVYCAECKSFHDRESAIEAFKKDFEKRIKKDKEFKKRVLELKDKRLGCFCKMKHDSPNYIEIACHGDIYAEYLNNLDENNLI